MRTRRSGSVSIILAMIFALLSAEGLSYAFDPFTVGQVISGVFSLVDSASELTATADAFNELYSELDSDAQMSESGRKLVDDITEVKHMAEEAGYTSEEISRLTRGDEQDAKKLVDLLRKMTQAVRTAKRVNQLISRLDSKAKLAAVESAQTEREILKTEYEQLVEIKRQALDKKKEELRKKLEKKRWVEMKENWIKAIGGMKWGKIGVYSFPNMNPRLKEVLDIAIKFRQHLIGLLLVAFLFRTVQNGVQFAGPEGYGKIFTDIFICGIWFVITPSLLSFICNSSQGLAHIVGDLKVASQVVAPAGPAPQVSGWMELYQYISWIFAVVKIYCFEVAEFVSALAMGIMIASFPLVVYKSTLFGFGMGMGKFLSIFLALSLWPIYWNLLGVLATLFWTKSQLLSGDTIYSVVLSIFQLFSPWLGYKFMQGYGAGTAAGSLLSRAVNSPLGVRQFGRGLSLGASGEVGGGQWGNVLGSSLRGGSSLLRGAVERSGSARDRMAQDSLKGGSTLGSRVKAGISGFVTNQSLPSHSTSESFLRRSQETAQESAMKNRSSSGAPSSRLQKTDPVLKSGSESDK